jgi:hypothetical protein
MLCSFLIDYFKYGHMGFQDILFILKRERHRLPSRNDYNSRKRTIHHVIPVCVALHPKIQCVHSLCTILLPPGRPSWSQSAIGAHVVLCVHWVNNLRVVFCEARCYSKRRTEAKILTMIKQGRKRIDTEA